MYPLFGEVQSSADKRISREAEVSSRARDKEIRQYEKKANRAAVKALDAKRTKETAEIRARCGWQVEVLDLKDQLAFLEDQFATVQRLW